MRIAPIEKPKGLLTRIAYWMSRRQLGKVMKESLRHTCSANSWNSI